MLEGEKHDGKQFWMKLDQGAGNAEKMLEMAGVIRQAYDENLGIICGVRHITSEALNQLYVTLNETEPNSENNRYMLCYSSREMGKSDPLLTEACEKLPVRFVIDNALNKPVIGGLIINRHSKNKCIIIPKQLLGDPAMVFEAFRSIIINPNNPFNAPFSKKR